MNKIAQGLIGATAAILLLAGCSAVSAEAQGVPSATPSVTPSATPAPLAVKVVPSPSPSHNPDWGDYTQDEFFIASAARGWNEARPTDQQLIATAHDVCETLREGTPRVKVRVTPATGEVSDLHNLRIVTYAIQVYCPEFTS